VWPLGVIAAWFVIAAALAGQAGQLGSVVESGATSYLPPAYTEAPMIQPPPGQWQSVSGTTTGDQWLPRRRICGLRKRIGR
jgi:hypothetical protein